MNTLKYTLLVAVIWLQFSLSLAAQERAVTESGDTIYVYDDGTWSFDRVYDRGMVETGLNYLKEELLLDTSAVVYQLKAASSTKELSSKSMPLHFSYDQELWNRIPPGQLNDDAEFAFQSTGKEIYALVISEESAIGTENLFKIAMNTIEESVGSKPEVRQKEYRMVNGTYVISYVYQVSVSGLELVFHGYCASNDNGSVQVTAWTTKNLYERYAQDMEALLNGLVIK